MSDDLVWLLKRYASGRQLCNCSSAYYDKPGICAHGCDSNRITATEEIARRAAKEIRALTKTAGRGDVGG